MPCLCWFLFFKKLYRLDFVYSLKLYVYLCWKFQVLGNVYCTYLLSFLRLFFKCFVGWKLGNVGEVLDVYLLKFGTVLYMLLCWFSFEALWTILRTLILWSFECFLFAKNLRFWICLLCSFPKLFRAVLELFYWKFEIVLPYT